MMLLQVALDPVPGSPGPPAERFVFAQPQSRAEVMVARMDGGFFAQIGSDLSLHKLSAAYAGDPGGAAFRASRPLAGWLAWLGSAGGQRSLLAPALMAITALSMGGAVWAIQAAVAARGGRAKAPAAAAIMPGMLIGIIAPGLCDPVAAALCVAAVALHRRGQFGWTIALLSAAVLTRETTVIVAGALALVDLAKTRRLTPLLLVGVPVALYAAWNVVVYQLVGGWFWQAGSGQMSKPFVGLAAGITQWSAMEVVTFGVLVAAFAMLWTSGDPHLRVIAVLHLVLALLLGEIVWKLWWGFGRVLLPVQLLAFVALKHPAPEPGAAHDAAAPPSGGHLLLET